MTRTLRGYRLFSWPASTGRAGEYDRSALTPLDHRRDRGIDDRTGSLPTGKEADLIMICRDHADMLPATDVAATIVAGSHADNVDLVMVADRRGPPWSRTGPHPTGGAGAPSAGCFMTATWSTQ
ncbi:hypothetical protein [Nocardia sp. NPDC002869]|uniref:hypothetical protein n=1 Tax=Nocardia sp. NPDC002869 TaxID=3161032 RepID=UPI00398CB911